MTDKPMISAWRIGTDTAEYLAEDMRGTGAALAGGRWNPVSLPMVYGASNAALACLETVVHLTAPTFPLNRYLVRIDIPQSLWSKAKTISAHHAPVGWDAHPPGKVSIEYGRKWAEQNSSALLLVPSVVVPEEHNVLINPRHAGASHIKAVKLRKWIYDSRLSRRSESRRSESIRAQPASSRQRR